MQNRNAASDSTCEAVGLPVALPQGSVLVRGAGKPGVTHVCRAVVAGDTPGQKRFCNKLAKLTRQKTTGSHVTSKALDHVKVDHPPCQRRATCEQLGPDVDWVLIPLRVTCVHLKRLQWLGAPLRLPAHRRVHKVVRARFDSATVPPGSILMDAPTTATFAELVARAEDKQRWQQLCGDTFPQLCTSGQRR